MGPMAQDFKGAFGLGDDDKTINTLAADGVVVAAVQGLHAIGSAETSEIASHADEIALLEQSSDRSGDRLRDLELRLRALEEL